MISSIVLSVSRLVVILIIGGGLVFPSKKAIITDSVLNQSVQSIQLKSVLADSLQLTEQKVKDWIRTRIAIAKLQNQMKANGADYDAVVKEFFNEREILLESRGWSVAKFDAVKERIHAAITAMDMEDELEETRADYEEEVAKIESNEFFSEEQKQEMINGLKSMRDQKRTLYIDSVKSDLPTIRPYRNLLQQMTDWIAGNTANPPKLD